MFILQMGQKIGLIVWLSFIDDMLIVCAEDTMDSVKKSSQKLLIVMILKK